MAEVDLLLCRSSYYTDMGLHQQPGQREVRCNRSAEHLDDHAEIIDGEIAVLWPRRTPLPRTWSLPPEPAPEVKAVKSTLHDTVWIWRRTEDNQWDAAGLPCSWTHLVATFSSPEHPLTEVVDGDGQ